MAGGDVVGAGAMKQWRVYVITDTGKGICLSRSYRRESCETFAMTSVLFGRRTLANGKYVVATELRSPDGRVWRYNMPSPGTPAQEAAAKAKFDALPAEEKSERSRAAARNVLDFFTSEEPPVDPVVERVMQKFRAKLAERGS